MYSLAFFLAMLAVQFPILVVLVVGLVLLSTLGRRLPPRSRLLARAGLGAMLAEVIASAAWSVVVSQLFTRTSGSGASRSIGMASATAGFLLAVLFATGIGLLLAALLAARDPAPPASQPLGPVPHDDVPPGQGPPGDGRLGDALPWGR